MKAEAERDEGDGRHSPPTLPAGATGEVRARATAILDTAWRERPDGSGFCVPNPTTYPWQWLWDSCFHSVVWAHLGDERAVRELRSALQPQDADGFVPHVRYGDAPNPHAGFWGRPTTSSITQPPMYGHAVAELARRGLAPPDDVVARATAGLRFLLHQRKRSPAGLVELCHPWESGCDDSPRWDAVLAGQWAPDDWYEAKGHLLASVERSGGGAPLANPAFPVGAVGFSSLVAWNAWELAEVTGDDELRARADDLAAAVDARWEPGLGTWVDDGPTEHSSGRVRTLDALLAVLVAPRAEAFAQLDDPLAFGAACGPRGVHAAEPTYEPTRYWRGPAWPQLTYLVWLAAKGREPALAGSLVRSMVAGALRSGFAEYWEPDSGGPLGAVPQSWTTLSWVMVDE